MIFEEEGEEVIVCTDNEVYLVRVENGIGVVYNARGDDEDIIVDYSRRIGRFNGRRIILDEIILPSESVPSTKTTEFGVSM